MRNNSFSSSPRSGRFLDGRLKKTNPLSWILVFFAINPFPISEMSSCIGGFSFLSIILIFLGFSLLYEVVCVRLF
ncbi:hypothetical protein LguiA_002030 [Lonicera macranthoides]